MRILILIMLMSCGGDPENESEIAAIPMAEPMAEDDLKPKKSKPKAEPKAEPEARSELLGLYSGEDRVGNLFWISDVSGDYWVIGTDGSRYEIDRVDGNFPNGYFYYKKMDCTGEMRMGISNGEFKTVAKNFKDEKFYRKIGKDKGDFVYKSRMAGSTNCQNKVSWVNESWDSTEIELDWIYPLQALEIK